MQENASQRRITWIESTDVLAKVSLRARTADERSAQLASRLADLRRLARKYSRMRLEAQSPLSLSFAG